MHSKYLKITVALSVLTLALLLFFHFSASSSNDALKQGPQRSASARQTSKRGSLKPVRTPLSVEAKKASKRAYAAKAPLTSSSEELTNPQMEERRRAAEEEEALVAAFDAVTTQWMESTGKSVTADDALQFCDRFNQLPKNRKEECLQRALNLIPDENIGLLTGILMDKSQDKGLIQLVYHDVLNRGEDVKKPILEEIFRDREHPCWADTAWILDVTGTLPKEKDK